jgi:hypothetical protein
LLSKYQSPRCNLVLNSTLLIIIMQKALYVLGFVALAALVVFFVVIFAQGIVTLLLPTWPLWVQFIGICLLVVGTLRSTKRR